MAITYITYFYSTHEVSSFEEERGIALPPPT